MFWPLQSNSELSRVLEDSQVPISGVWVSSSHSLKVGLWHLQNSWIWNFILQCVNFMCLKLWDIGWIMFKKLNIHWMNGMWFKFITLWIFLISKNYNYFKSFFNHFKKLNNFFWYIFYMSYNIMILKLEMEKNVIFNIIQIFIFQASF